MRKIKRDDEVIVIAGRDKNKRGKVLKVLDDGRLIVSGIQMVKKHQKGNPNTGTQSTILDKEAPIQASNVAIYNPQTEKADRVGFRFLEDPDKPHRLNKVRYFKSNDELIDI